MKNNERMKRGFSLAENFLNDTEHAYIVMYDGASQGDLIQEFSFHGEKTNVWRLAWIQEHWNYVEKEFPMAKFASKEEALEFFALHTNTGKRNLEGRCWYRELTNCPDPMCEVELEYKPHPFAPCHDASCEFHDDEKDRMLRYANIELPENREEAILWWKTKCDWHPDDNPKDIKGKEHLESEWRVATKECDPWDDALKQHWDERVALAYAGKEE